MLVRKDALHQLLEQQTRHKSILRWRTVTFWWYRILFTILAVCTAGVVGRYFSSYPLQVVGCILVLPIIFLVVKHTGVGLVLFAITTTAFFPKILSFKSLDIYPSLLLLLLLGIVLLVQSVFRVQVHLLPSLWTIWPLIGLCVMSVLSNLIIQTTWSPSVPHQINNNPILYSEALGVIAFLLPLITFAVTTAIVSRKKLVIAYILNSFLIIAVVAALFVLNDFRSIGVDIYTFRNKEPAIGWMDLYAVAQLLCVGAMIAYARLLYAKPFVIRQITRRGFTFSQRTISARWMRVIYCLCLLLCLVSIVVILQNSWWLEIGVAIIVMTLFHSRRLLLVLGLAVLPCIPFLEGVFTKLQAVKTDDYVRLAIWQDALRVWGMHPLFGVGPGNYWAYDQVFTNLPRAIHNFNTSGLGVAHNGYLQVLGEMGIVGLFFWIAFPVVLFVASVRLFHRSKVGMDKKAKSVGNVAGLQISNTFNSIDDRILSLVSLGLITGLMVADFTAGTIILPPRQTSLLSQLPPVMLSWIVWGCVLYKDKLWRRATSDL